MPSLPAAHLVIKDVVLDPFEPWALPSAPARVGMNSLGTEAQRQAASARGDRPALPEADVAVTIPYPSVPALFVRIETGTPPGLAEHPAGMQFVEEGGDRLHYVNL